jgi:hypothetical protein
MSKQVTPDEYAVDVNSDDHDALGQWTLFLEQYAKGHQLAPLPPTRATPALDGATPPPTESLKVPLYPPGEVRATQ